MAFPSDITIVGTVLAVTVAILLLSGLALYVAFRVRDTLREEKGRGARVAKVAFLIGLLFLSGGVFYFFASGFNASAGSAQAIGTTSATVSTSYSSSTTSHPARSTSSSATSTSSSSTTTATTSTSGGSVSMQASYPSSVSAGQGFYVQFSIYNSGPSAASGVSLDVGGISATFTIVNATVCSPGCSQVTWSGGVINVGSLNTGSTVIQVGLKAPSTPTQFSGTATLNYQGEAQPVTASITIRVTGRP